MKERSLDEQELFWRNLYDIAHSTSKEDFVGDLLLNSNINTTTHDVDATPLLPNLTEAAQEYAQDFKELNLYLDDLYKQMASGEKDAGNLWIQFTDKFNAFQKRVIAGANSTNHVRPGKEDGKWDTDLTNINLPSNMEFSKGSEFGEIYYRLQAKDVRWIVFSVDRNYYVIKQESLNHWTEVWTKQMNRDLSEAKKYAEDDLEKSFPSRQPSIPTDLVKRLRESNPYNDENGKPPKMIYTIIWNECCDKLSELLNQTK